ncbi:RNA-binding component of cleavage and polyadenylation factor [Rhodotorula mucilaginosa]|uniref:mRNA 3'-end-processing protein n=1 Tax=Rhodotorula mucilaginosa TaxID=5537 RepID=A0A9P6W309_RHOMI|nr:RNA-binding component of cleavage and polyadenylation factor [Rhodotorula mucilaginosa]
MAQVEVQTDPRKLFQHADLSIEPFLKSQLALRLDADRQLCPDHVVAHQPCPRGAACPYRHVQPSPLNFQPKQPVPQSAHARTVCKHWLRGLCKKGPQCEFMHEYHLRKMPECWFFAKYGFCSNGDECMYLHVTEEMRIRECPDYRKGFCPKGPDCKLKHVRRVMCPDYLVGFCKNGKDCPYGHAKFEPEPEPPASSTRIPDVSGARFLPEATFRLYRKDWLEHAADPTGRSGSGAQDWNRDGGGGGGGGNRGGGGDHRGGGMGGGMQSQGMGGGGGKRDLSKQIGHFANHCPNGAAGGDRGGGGGGGGVDLSTITCFKCGEKGHFANHCPQSAGGGARRY